MPDTSGRIGSNSLRLLANTDIGDRSDDDIVGIRESMGDIIPESLSNDDIRSFIRAMGEAFRYNALTAAQAATIILSTCGGTRRILVGDAARSSRRSGARRPGRRRPGRLDLRPPIGAGRPTDQVGADITLPRRFDANWRGRGEPSANELGARPGYRGAALSRRLGEGAIERPDAAVRGRSRTGCDITRISTSVAAVIVAVRRGSPIRASSPRSSPLPCADDCAVPSTTVWPRRLWSIRDCGSPPNEYGAGRPHERRHERRDEAQLAMEHSAKGAVARSCSRSAVAALVPDHSSSPPWEFVYSTRGC